MLNDTCISTIVIYELSTGNHKLRLKNRRCNYGHLSFQLWSSQRFFFKSDFLFHIHLSVIICDFLAISSYITIVPMHMPFKIHYRNNLIDKKDSYPISRPPSWDDRNYSYGHQLYHSLSRVVVPAYVTPIVTTQPFSLPCK